MGSKIKKTHRLRRTRFFRQQNWAAECAKNKKRSRRKSLPDSSTSAWYENHRNSGASELGMWERKIPPPGISEREGNKRKCYIAMFLRKC